MDDVARTIQSRGEKMNGKNYTVTYTVKLNIKASGRNLADADTEAWDKIQEVLNELPAEVNWDIYGSEIEEDILDEW